MKTIKKCDVGKSNRVVRNEKNNKLIDQPTGKGGYFCANSEGWCLYLDKMLLHVKCLLDM